MAIESFSQDMNIISRLPDAPTFTPAQLKGKFDEGGILIKEYINSVLIPALTEELEGFKEETERTLDSAIGALPSVTDSLTSTSTTAALSAAKGKALNDSITKNADAISLLQTTVNTINTTLSQKQKKITSGQGAPSGGANGDIYLMY